MLSLLYDIFISPLIWGMNFVLVNAYSVLHSYGLAIVVLSLVVNTVLLPLYHMADKWQQEEREKQNKMADKVAEIKQAFQGQERFMMLKTLYRQNHYHPIMAVRNSVGFLIQVPFFFAAYQFLSHFPALNGQSFGPFANLGLPDGLLTIGDFHINVMPFVMTCINLISAFVYTKGLSSKDKIQLYVFAGIFLVLLYTSPVGLVLYWTLNNVYSLGKNLVSANADNIENSQFVSLLKAPFTFVSKAYENVVPKKIRDITIIPEIKSSLICFSSLYIIVFLIAAYVPINVYLSDPAFFHITLSDVVKYGVRTIVVTLAIFGIIYLCLNEKLKGKLTFIVTVLSLIALFNILVPLRNYGVIDTYLLTNELQLDKYKTSFAIDAVIFIVFYLFLFSSKNHVIKISKLISIITISITLITTFNIFKNNNEKEKTTIVNSSNNLLPNYNYKLNSYSKTNKNIVVIMLDMFTGDHVSHIFKNYPNLKDNFNGFTWYPDTITSGHSTFISEPSIHGGHSYTTEAINKRKEIITSLTDEISKGYKVFNNNFGSHGFDISLYGTQFASCENIERHVNTKYLKVCKTLQEQSDYFEYYLKQKDLKENFSSVNDNKFLLVYGAFSISPYYARKNIYDTGSWLGVVKSKKNKNDSFDKKSFGKFAYLDLMSDISNTKSKNPTFKYIQTEITHLPFKISKDLKLTNNDPYPNTEGMLTKVDGIIPEHLYTEAFSLKAISKWIKWLKDNNIYNNTMIVLVSDHGEGDSVSLSKAFGMNVSGHYKYGENQGYPGRSHGLLMIKDFNNNSPFKVSDSHMITSDVPSIVCETIGGCNNIEKDPRLHNNKRQRIFSEGSWSPKNHKVNEYIIYSRYIIDGSIFNKNNWKKVK